MNDKTLVARIQELLDQLDVSAWLFCDFRGSDPMSYQVLGLDPEAHVTRRWFYLVPAEGEPVKIVHRIESEKLDILPGRKMVYLEWESLHSALREALRGAAKVAMQYSPGGAIPYVSRVDAGTVEMIRQFGVDVISSADLIQHIEAVWTEAQVRQHRQAALAITRVVQEAFEEAAREIRANGQSSEYRVQQFILGRFEEESLATDFPPIVAVNQNSGNPHYGPDSTTSSPLREGDFLLIDLWASPAEPGAMFADITWTGWLGSDVPARVQDVFQIVKEARDAGLQFLQRRFREGRTVCGWEVDDVVRAVIRRHGYADSFIHRTGHNLGRDIHGNGVNFDNLETHDTRRVIPGIACTIEPGIYLPEFGIRSEINVYFSSDGPEVTTPPQENLMICPI